MKKILIKLFLIAIIMSIVTTNVVAVDISNNTTGTDTGLGNADPGDAQVASSAKQQKFTMWKISVWVGRNDNVTNTSDETLTDDYYQFGSTFWIYRSSGDYPVSFSASDIIATQNKEDYLRGDDKSFRKGTYSSLSYRIFAGETYGFDGKSDATRVPYVPNCGTVTGMTKAQIVSAMNSFFKDNPNTSNVLVNLAAVATGYSDGEEKAYIKLLKNMINSEKFIVNDHILKEEQLNMIDPYRSKLNDGTYEKEASSLAWVIMYEPVLRFSMSGSSDADRYYVTASDIAALMTNGIINFSGTSASNMVYRFSPTYRKNHGISSPDSNTIIIDGKSYSIVSKNCTTPFFVNLANSVYLSEDWLGYGVPVISNPPKESDDLWLVNSTVYGWYADTMLERAGFGLRYQKSNVEYVEIQKNVTIVGTNESYDDDFSDIQFKITDTGSNEIYYVDLNNEGKGRVQLPIGTYTIEELKNDNYRLISMSSKDTELTDDGNDVFTFTLYGLETNENGGKTIQVYNEYLLKHTIRINYKDKYTGEVIYFVDFK